MRVKIQRVLGALHSRVFGEKPGKFDRGGGFYLTSFACSGLDSPSYAYLPRCRGPIRLPLRLGEFSILASSARPKSRMRETDISMTISEY
jgi:hypothetical protein